MTYFEQRMAEINAERERSRPVPPLPIKPPPEPVTGYIYFLKMGSAVKIGFSTNVRSRLRTIRTSCPDPLEVLKIVPGTSKTERSFHHRFQRYRQQGEWFRLEGVLAKFVAGNGEPVIIPDPIPEPEFFL